MATTTDIVVRVLDLLGVTQVGQDPAAEDVEKIESFIPDAVADLQTRRIVVIDPTNVPDVHVGPFATIIASRAAPAFGASRDSDAETREEARLLQNQTTFSRRRGAQAVAI